MPKLIVMSGLPGSGKSTLAQLLARQIRAPIFSVDPAESAIVRSGLKQGFETGLAAYLVVQTLADAQLALGLDAIVDAVNAEEPAKDMWRALSRTRGVPLRIIECRCSDETLHRERLSTRRRGLEGVREPTWEDVQRRRQAYTSWSEPILSIDAASPLDVNLNRSLAWLHQA